VIVAVARLELRIPFAHSLKEKRKVIRSLMGKVKARFDVRMSEVGDHDRWQSAEVGFAVVGSSRAVLEGVVDSVVDYASSIDAELTNVERHTLFFDDLAHLADSAEGQGSLERGP
jgi:uncharacterized protein YlxP (DUF503 family)